MRPLILTNYEQARDVAFCAPAENEYADLLEADRWLAARIQAAGADLGPDIKRAAQKDDIDEVMRLQQYQSASAVILKELQEVQGRVSARLVALRREIEGRTWRVKKLTEEIRAHLSTEQLKRSEAAGFGETFAAVAEREGEVLANLDGQDEAIALLPRQDSHRRIGKARSDYDGAASAASAARAEIERLKAEIEGHAEWLRFIGSPMGEIINTAPLAAGRLVTIGR